MRKVYKCVYVWDKYKWPSIDGHELSDAFVEFVVAVWIVKNNHVQDNYFFLSADAPFFLAVPRNFLERFLRSLRNLREAFSTLVANPLRTNRKRGSKFMDSRES